MLVLSRFQGEKIFINYGTKDEICISLLRINDDKASIGIEAPKNMNIVREEILHRDNQEGIEQDSQE